MEERLREPIDENNPEMCREVGKFLYFSEQTAQEEKKRGLHLLLRAVMLGDNEARCIVGKFLVEGQISVPEKMDSREAGMTFLWQAAREGEVRANALLEEYCEKAYRERVPYSKKAGPLEDFSGERITIDRKGLLTPVDARLSYENGENLLRLSANLVFSSGESQAEDRELLREAVSDGIRMWEGEYTVFGGQKLRVSIELTYKPRVFDTVKITLLSDQVSEAVKVICDQITAGEKKERIDHMLEHDRSFAATGARRWSVTSRKHIFLQSRTDRFNDYDEIRHIVKHEFGHVLGLGDLYRSAVDRLGGVQKGSYAELDGYYISNDIYHLVMCDHRAPVRNNDIEMVVLAFSENQRQNFQRQRKGDQISEALGRGN